MKYGSQYGGGQAQPNGVKQKGRDVDQRNLDDDKGDSPDESDNHEEQMRF